MDFVLQLNLLLQVLLLVLKDALLDLLFVLLLRNLIWRMAAVKRLVHVLRIPIRVLSAECLLLTLYFRWLLLQILGRKDDLHLRWSVLESLDLLLDHVVRARGDLVGLRIGP